MPRPETLESLMDRYSITGVYADFESIDDAFNQMTLHIKELRERINQLEKVLANPDNSVQNAMGGRKLIAVEKKKWPVDECNCTCGEAPIRSHFHARNCECLIEGE